MKFSPAEQGSADRDLEREKLDWEIERQKQDFVLRERELSWKIQEARRATWTSPLFLALVAAVIGLFGNAIVTIIQGINGVRLKESETAQNLRLEKEKLTSNLILESIKTGNPASAATNLLFLAKIGLISEDTDKLAKYLSAPDNVPVLPSANSNRVSVDLTLSNSCDVGIRAVIMFMAEDKTWQFIGWLNFLPKSTQSVVIPSSNRILYIYGESSDGAIVWSGDNQNKFDGRALLFRDVAADAASTGNPFLYTFRCSQ
jgi:hypothetical protein